MCAERKKLAVMSHKTGEKPSSDATWAGTCQPEDAGQRLDVYLAGCFPEFSRSAIQEWVRDGRVRLNGVRTKPGAKVFAGDVVQADACTAVEPSAALLVAEDIPLHVLYEDDDMLVIDKPPGLAVHPGAGMAGGTVANALAHRLRNEPGTEPGRDLRSGIVHRLDKDTSGLLVLAKNQAAQWKLSRAFAEREVHKHYLAVVGTVPDPSSGRIDLPIRRHPVHRTRMTVARPGEGRQAATLYRTRAVASGRVLLECKLLTGRTHQIRVHLQAIGCPILGDRVYNPRGPVGYPRQLLHAWRLAIRQPTTQKWLAFTVPPPQDFPEFEDAEPTI